VIDEFRHSNSVRLDHRNEQLLRDLEDKLHAFLSEARRKRPRIQQRPQLRLVDNGPRRPPDEREPEHAQ
jgi:hypothetical protein